jgi:hypothetical protein
MVTALMQAPPPEGGASSSTLLTLIVLGGLLWWGAIVQLNPFTRCGWCDGKAPSDESGRFYHRCWRCGGASEILRPSARFMRAFGIPVPRARPGAKRNKRGL